MPGFTFIKPPVKALAGAICSAGCANGLPMVGKNFPKSPASRNKKIKRALADEKVHKLIKNISKFSPVLAIAKSVLFQVGSYWIFRDV